MAMRRSARRPEPEFHWTTPLRGGAAALGGFVVANPVLVGGSTAFLVALMYVSANALWYQPHAHSSAFFSTRGFAEGLVLSTEPETTIVIERPGEVDVQRPAGDPRIEMVQDVLRDLKLYAGEVDGLMGPNTKKAIVTYQTMMDLPATGAIDEELLEQLGLSQTTTAGIVPTPRPRPEVLPETEMVQGIGPEPRPEPDADSESEEDLNPIPVSIDRATMKIQAGLRAFGNEDIEVDGVLGTRTKAAIKEFQALFGLPETGLPDDELYRKMQEIGLTN
jgi:peptidoglycan hydrolase-like protein with peptidoglycan-binding domain